MAASGSNIVVPQITVESNPLRVGLSVRTGPSRWERADAAEALLFVTPLVPANYTSNPTGIITGHRPVSLRRSLLTVSFTTV